MNILKVHQKHTCLKLYGQLFGTVQDDNILFGLPFDEAFYPKLFHVTCTLKPNLITMGDWQPKLKWRAWWLVRRSETAYFFGLWSIQPGQALCAWFAFVFHGHVHWPTNLQILYQRAHYWLWWHNSIGSHTPDRVSNSACQTICWWCKIAIVLHTMTGTPWHQAIISQFW